MEEGGRPGNRTIQVCSQWSYAEFSQERGYAGVSRNGSHRRCYQVLYQKLLQDEGKECRISDDRIWNTSKSSGRIALRKVSIAIAAAPGLGPI